MIYWLLFYEFIKIGTFSVGGGLATIPFIHHMIERYGWITEKDLLNMIAVAESTPGPIGVNVATFTGFKTAGVLGGIVATLGLILPSIFVIIAIAHYFARFNEKPLVQGLFSGIRPAVVGLIAAAGYSVVTVALIHPEAYRATGSLAAFFDIKGILLFAVMMFLIQKYKKHPIFYIIAAGILGVVFKF